MRHASLPPVYLDRDPSLKGKIRFSVNADLKSSAEIAAKELLALDFDDYAFVGFPLPLFWTKEREKAFCEAIKLNGRRCHVFDSGARPGIRRLESLRKWLRELPKPCGILAAFDGTAEEVLAACSLENIRVPEDFAVMGIDNNEEICDNTKPTLSSICPDFEKAGFLCGELLDKQLRDPKARGENRTFGILGVVKRKSTTVFKHTDARVTAAVEYIRLGCPCANGAGRKASPDADDRSQTRRTIPSRGSASGGIVSGSSGESSPGRDFHAAEYMGSPCSRNIVSNSVQTSFGRGIGSTRS